MKNKAVFVSSCFVICMATMPAFADTLGGILGGLPIVGGLLGGGSSPAGAPAPLLAAGIPAFIALGGGALLTKLLR